MHKLIIAITGLALLAGCNSTDALIPQVDVGEGTFRSPPVNQADLDTMSSQPAYVPPQETASVQSAPLDAQPDYRQPQPDTSFAQGDVDYTDPAGSLEAQASRLSQGDVPAQERQIARSTPQLTQTADNAPAENEQPAEQQVPPLQAAAEQPRLEKPQQSAAIAPKGEANSIRFLPIIGAPVAAVTSLSKQLGADARAHGLTIKSSSDASSQHILKGYFSALKDGGKTTVVYIWDVLDGSGNRLHRIQGQDTVDATAADPWAAVPPETMQAIASKSIETYLAWARANAG
ncbi:hypothetical protein QO002_003358 [Pararhizobium capsulatum DSM 1112]|uniref:Lipoprotein n=1 Tax=Pararhizobium capsulatum DSM 1112 TaxID=1121113 RepID=A0ABU0BSJ6_9HYPH|nr:hypothetical protein [Pararhizobium capsulatum]MDQ0321220.1 hypothetical protein [Pararhizobium capsulatum DSM 1112]